MPDTSSVMFLESLGVLGLSTDNINDSKKSTILFCYCLDIVFMFISALCCVFVKILSEQL